MWAVQAMRRCELRIAERERPRESLVSRGRRAPPHFAPAQLQRDTPSQRSSASRRERLTLTRAPPLDGLHRLADEVPASATVELGVRPALDDVVDLVDGDRLDLSPHLDGDALEILGGPGIRRSGGPGSVARGLKHGQQLVPELL